MIRLNKKLKLSFLRLDVILFSILFLVASFIGLLDTPLPFIGLIIIAAYLFIPGYILLRALRVNSDVGFIIVLYSIGLSIMMLISIGLAIGYVTDLTSLNIAVITNIFVVTMCWITIKHGNSRHLNLRILRRQNFDIMTIFHIVLLVLIPLFTVFGAIRLNNYGSEHISLVAILLMIISAISALRLSYIKNKNTAWVFPVTIFIISISLLFMTSLRSNLTPGHDIVQELRVANATIMDSKWSPGNSIEDAYNACLSISLLPGILHVATGVSTILIFKVVFQIIFAGAVVGIYYFLKKFNKNNLAFLSTILFISIPTFFIDLPMINRQEIALFYFILLLIALFDKGQRLILKNILVLNFAIGIVISHYSTTYIAVATLSLAFIISRLFVILKIFKNTSIDRSSIVNLPLICIMLLFSILWYGQITQSNENIQKFIGSSVVNIKSALKISDNNENSSISGFNNISSPEAFDLYNERLITKSPPDALIKNKAVALVDNSIGFQAAQYQPINVNQGLVSNISKIINVQIFMIKIFIVVGVIYLFIRSIIKSENIDFLAYVLAAFLILAITVIFPALNSNYGSTRVYQQSLILLALPAVVAMNYLSSLILKKNSIIGPALFVLLYFSLMTGFITQITGGFQAQINLNNTGVYFDKYYAHKSEQIAGYWISGVDYSGDTIRVNADPSTTTRLQNYSTLPLSSFDNDLAPPLINKNSYVFFGYTNSVKNIALTYYKGKLLIYSLPVEFYENNKNFIYSNGESRFYK